MKNRFFYYNQKTLSIWQMIELIFAPAQVAIDNDGVCETAVYYVIIGNKLCIIEEKQKVLN